jgi:WD40 repeat protein
MLLPLLALALAAAADTAEAQRRRKVRSTIAGMLEEILEVEASTSVRMFDARDFNDDLEQLRALAEQSGERGLEERLRQALALTSEEAKTFWPPNWRTALGDTLLEARGALIVANVVAKDGESWPLKNITMSNDRKHFAVSEDLDRVHLMESDWRESVVIELQDKFREKAESLAFHPNGRVLAVGTRDGYIRLFNLSGKKTDSPLSVGKSVKHMAFDPNGRLAFSTADSIGVRVVPVSVEGVFGPESIEVRKGKEKPGDPPPYLAWSPDGRRLAVIGEEKKNQFSIVILDATKKKTPWTKVKRISLPDGPIQDAALSPKGDRLAVAAWKKPSGRAFLEAQLQVIDLDSDESQDIDLRGQILNIASVAWSPNGQRIAVGEYGPCKSHVIDLVSGRIVSIDDNSNTFVSFLDDDRLVVASKQVKIYDLRAMGL